MFQVTGTATNYSSVKWLTAGDGHFSDDTILYHTEYYPGISDRSNGGVLLSLQAYPVAPCSDTATDTVFIRLTSTEGTISGATIPFEVARFRQSEQFRGILVNLFPNAMYEKTQRGFEAMNRALKERVEKIYA